MSTYDTDFCAWADQQRDLLVERRFDLLDLENLIEEVGDLAGSQRRELASHIRNVLVHLLKLAYTLGSRDPERNWRMSILAAQVSIEDLVNESPSLRPLLPTYVAEQYVRAMRQAHNELSIYGDDHQPFPDTCPWTAEQVLDPEFLPEVERDAD